MKLEKIIIFLSIILLLMIMFSFGWNEGLSANLENTKDNCYLITTYEYKDGTTATINETCNRNYTAFNPDKTNIYQAYQKVYFK